MVSDTVLIMDNDLSPLYSLSIYNDTELDELAVAIAAEQIRRASQQGDVEAMVEEAFAKAFVKGKVAEPWMQDGLLFTPGLLVGTGKLSHDCTFHKVGDEWSWESSDKLDNQLRSVPYGAKIAQESITLLAVPTGTEITRVVMKLSGGGHRVISTMTYKVHYDHLEIIGASKGASAGGYSH